MDENRRPEGPTQQFNVELDPAELARIDALIPSHSTPSRKAARETMVRILLGAGLEALEKKRVPMPLSAHPRRGGAR